MMAHLNVTRTHYLLSSFSVVFGFVSYTMKMDNIFLFISGFLCVFHLLIALGASKKKILACRLSQIYAVVVFAWFPLGTLTAMYLIANSWTLEKVGG